MFVENVTKENSISSKLTIYSKSGVYDELLQKIACSDGYEQILLAKMLENDYECRAILAGHYYKGYYVKENVNFAIDALDNALQHGSAIACFYKGRVCYDKNEYLQCIEYVETFLKSKFVLNDSDMGLVYCILGDSYTRLPNANISKAIECLTLAAERYKEGYAYRRLGLLNLNNDSRDIERSVTYLRKGANLGDRTSAVILSRWWLFEYDTIGIEKNYFAAIKVLQPYIEKGDKDKDIIYHYGLACLLSDDDELVSGGLYYLKKAYEEYNEERACSYIGIHYYDVCDYDMARHWFLKVINKSDIAKLYLANIFYNGYGVDKNYAKAYELFVEVEMEYFDGETCKSFAQLLSSGYPQYTDYERAYDVADLGDEKYDNAYCWILKAILVLNKRVNNRMSKEEAENVLVVCAEKGLYKKESHFALGLYYYGTANYRKAEYNLIEAYKNGQAEAAVSLGFLYEKGGGTISPNIEKAYQWFCYAAQSGSERGKAEVSCFEKSKFGKYKRVRRVCVKS